MLELKLAIYHRAAGLSSQASSVNVCSIGCRIIYQTLLKCKGCPVLPAGVHAVWRIPRTSLGSSLDVPSHITLHAVWRIPRTFRDPPWMSLTVSVKPGLWTGLDWTDQNSRIQTANTTKATTACPQLCLKLLPCCWVLDAASSRFLKGQRSHAYLMSFNKGSSGWLLVVWTPLLVGSVKARPSMTCIYCFLWSPHASVWKAT